MKRIWKNIKKFKKSLIENNKGDNMYEKKEKTLVLIPQRMKSILYKYHAILGCFLWVKMENVLKHVDKRDCFMVWYI